MKSSISQISFYCGCIYMIWNFHLLLEPQLTRKWPSDSILKWVYFSVCMNASTRVPGHAGAQRAAFGKRLSTAPWWHTRSNAACQAQASLPPPTNKRFSWSLNDFAVIENIHSLVRSGEPTVSYSALHLTSSWRLGPTFNAQFWKKPKNWQCVWRTAPEQQIF